MTYRKGYYKKDGTYVQGHFVSKKKTNKNKVNNEGCFSTIVITLILIISISCLQNSDCLSKKCYDFSSQTEAQTTFNSNKNCYSNLDKDNNNIAYENGRYKRK
ncbi:hypothetical protein QYR09_06865 [Cellulophaga lytica]|nr:hypothetical protein QYR09_06865 [Cellulophaga lytica]